MADGSDRDSERSAAGCLTAIVMKFGGPKDTSKSRRCKPFSAVRQLNCLLLLVDLRWLWIFVPLGIAQPVWYFSHARRAAECSRARWN